jgi:hypothetical protein
MTKPIPTIERNKKFREKKSEQGYRQIAAYLSPETFNRLIELKKYFGSTYGGKFSRAKLISISIKNLHKKIFKM